MRLILFTLFLDFIQSSSLRFYIYVCVLIIICVVMDITNISLMSLILVGAATVTVFIVATILLKQKGEYRNRIPPGPRAIPIIGHFHLLIDKIKPVHQILSSLSTLYGPIMHLKFGSCPVLVISSSDLAKECLTVNDRSFASRPRLAQGQHLGYNYSILGWAPYGPYWRNARKICVLELLSSKRIQSFGPKRMQEIKKSVNSLFQQTQLQGIVNMRSVLSRLTFKVLMTMIIDERYFGEGSGISEDLITHLIEESFMLHGVIDIGDYIPWLKRFDLQGYVKAMKKVTERLDLYMQRIVEKHREKRLKDGVEMEDFVDVLISQAEENGKAIPDKDAFIKATVIVSACDLDSFFIYLIYKLLFIWWRSRCYQVLGQSVLSYEFILGLTEGAPDDT